MSEADTGNTVGEVASTSQPQGETQTDVQVVKPETPTDSQPQGEKTEPPKKEGGVAKRIKELVAEREAWREMAMRAQGITKEQDKKEAVQGKPQSSQFNSYEEYMEALSDWKVEQRLSEREQKSKKETLEREHQDRLKSSAKTFEERAEKFREKHDDFDDVAFDEFPVTPSMTEAILDSEMGPELLYHLGQNPKEAARIARLSPYAAAREIGKLEVKLSTPTPKKPSNAPDPINPVGGKEKVVTDMDKVPVSEWMKRRREQLKN